jgi:hypothetical protein
MGVFVRRQLSRGTVVGVWLSLLIFGVQQFSASRLQTNLPAQIGDEEFWRMVEEFSEPGGRFNSENFSSNERGYQVLIPKLQEVVRPGGVYLGVGPEQNFQYIAALRPAMAFIIDIRRQNLVQHLMYKAAFEMSADRADFLSRIFSRERPDGLGPESSVSDLMTAYRDLPADPELTAANIRAVKNWLTNVHKFVLSLDDERTMQHVMEVFAKDGTRLNYGSDKDGVSATRGNANQPDYAVLMALVDQKGENRSFLASEEAYAFIREMQTRNLIIPLVGDFGGPRALRAVGEYIRQHESRVMAFYLSNVEQYLFRQGTAQNGGWSNFYRSVATLPLDESSTFIRSGNTQGFGRGGGLTPVMSSVFDVLRAFNDGRLDEFSDVLALSFD